MPQRDIIGGLGKVLREPGDEGMVRLLRIRPHTGWPLASVSFMRKEETLLGRRVRPLPVGRQRGRRKVKEGIAAGCC